MRGYVPRDVDAIMAKLDTPCGTRLVISLILNNL